MVLVDRCRQVQFLDEVAVLDFLLMDRTSRTVAIDPRADDEQVPLVDPHSQALSVGPGEFDVNHDTRPIAIDIHIGIWLESAVVRPPDDVGKQPVELGS
jgi:hypothetical protein